MLNRMSRVLLGLSIALKILFFSLKIFPTRSLHLVCSTLKSDEGMGMMGRNDAPPPASLGDQLESVYSFKCHQG